MKVQLTPWKVTETTLKLQTAKRRRKRSGSGAHQDESHAQVHLPLAASFVERVEFPSEHSGPKRKKSTTNSKGSPRLGDIDPAVVVTSSHQIAVLGPGLTRSSEGPAWKESDVLQYNSRPDGASAFVSSSSDCYIPIPAVLDERNGYMYALQADNSKLVCWKTSSGGPDDDGAIRIKLKHSAVSLSVLQMVADSPLIYGSCDNGFIFLARLIKGSSSSSVVESWLVEYIEAPTTAGTGSKGDNHIFTRLQLLSRSHGQTGGKRKADEDESWTLVLYQGFLDAATGTDMILLKRQLSCTIYHITRGESFVQSGSAVSVQTVHIPLLIGPARKTSVATSAQSLGVADLNGDLTLVVEYTVNLKNGTNHINQTNRSQGRFFLSVSLDKGSQVTAPFELPSDTQAMGLSGSSHLFVFTSQQILLYDRLRGCQLYAAVLDLCKLGDPIALIGDFHEQRLVLLLAKNKLVSFATCSIVTDHSSTSKSRTMLADSLLLAQNSMPVDQLTSKSISNAVNLDTVVHKENEALQNTVKVMEEAFNDILNKKRSKHATLSLSVAFERVLDAFYTTTVSIEGPSGDCEKNDKNHHDDTHPRENGKVNGVKRNGELSVNGKRGKASAMLNGSHPTRSIIKSSTSTRAIPSVIVGVATRICVQTLLLKDLSPDLLHDSSFLLQRLFRTGKVSLRRQLPLKVFSKLLRVLEYSGGENVSSVDFIHDVLTVCDDVSEYHMVSMLRFYLREKATATLPAQTSKEREPRKSFVLVLKGVMVLLDRLLEYSCVNETLLLSAARDLLSQQEVILITQMLVAYLSGRFRKNAVSQVCRLRVIQWIGVFSGLVQSSGGKSVVTVSRAIHDELKRTENILAIKDIADRCMSGKKESTLSRNTTPNQRPPYQVERLVF